MEVTAWNNSKYHNTGAGYGIRIYKNDRINFDRNWKSIKIIIEGGIEFKGSIPSSFWNGTCSEIKKKDIGAWLIKIGFSRWDKGSPPKFDFVNVQGDLFELKRK